MFTKSKKTKIISVYSPQGGSGKSTIASNVAILASEQGLKTLLVDMSIFGNIIATFRITQKPGVGLAPVITHIDLFSQDKEPTKLNEIIKSSVVTDIDALSNLHVLHSANPIKMEAVNADYAKRIISSLRTLQYDLVIIDTSSELSERNVILMEESNFIIIPVVQDAACGWKLIQLKEITERYSWEKEKFGMIINKCSKYSGFNNKEFETETGYQIISEIPMFFKKYQNHINAGALINEKKNRKAYNSFLKTTKTILNIID